MNKVKFKVRPKKKVYESSLELEFAKYIPDYGTLEKRKRYFVFIENPHKENLKETLALVSASFQQTIWREGFNYEYDFLKTFERRLIRDLRVEGRIYNDAFFSFVHSDGVIFSLPYTISNSTRTIKYQIVTNFKNALFMFTYKDKSGRESVRFVDKLEHFDDYFIAKHEGVTRKYRYDAVTNLYFSRHNYGAWQKDEVDFSLYEIHMNLNCRGLTKETFLDLSLEEISIIKDYKKGERKNTFIYDYITHKYYWRD